MFKNADLQNHLETSSSISLESFVVAEWNMNIAENISKVGNYRYRPNDTENPVYNNLAESFSYEDPALFYTGATDADTVIDGGLEDDGTPLAFISSKQKEKMLFSLEDCFGRFRPRSGINKLRFFQDRYSHHDNIQMSRRPRYYMADKKDQFKYWSSFRTENGVERGVANQTILGQHYIEDAAPFVVYKNEIPANRIVVKLQTNVGDVNLGPFTNSAGTYDDPFFGDDKRTTPVNWKIQYLKGGNWVDAAMFNSSSVRRDGTPIIGSDGYVEIGYGLIIPEDYYSIFRYEKELASESLLPLATSYAEGTAFMVRNNENDRGTVHIIVDGEYTSFPASYGWQVIDEVNNAVSFVTDLTSPPSFTDDVNIGEIFREFVMIEGIRIAATTMNVFDATLDLVELSPRLAVNLSEKTTNFSIKKSASDLGVSGIPVGQLLASTGSLSLFDYDQAFFKENTNSIIKDYTSQNIQIKLYEKVLDVDGYDFYIPIKTMYSEGFPQVSNKDRSVELSLRDLFFYFESTTAPQIIVQDVSLSYVVSLLLDSVGFSNYVFLRNEGESEEVIPYFYVEPDQSLAEMLNKIARSTQSAMFFDEYNNFVVMSKGYMMPTESERSTDFVLRGTKDFEKSGASKNAATQASLANIISISSQDNEVFNGGAITYATRYIQRSYGSIRQASLLERDKTWVYKPALLWEVAPIQQVRSTNEEVADQSAYSLAAVALNSDLSSDVPSVLDHEIINNVIDLGEAVLYLSRYEGYFFANGEIIKYDAVQYSIPGLSETERTESGGDNVWITSTREYQNYFSKVPFNGKIYPTGLVRIYSEPNYEVSGGVSRLANGAVAKHGRGQFGTNIVTHAAGLSDYWTDNNNVRGVKMDTATLFGSDDAPETVVGAAGVDKTRAEATTRSGLIKNFFANEYQEETSSMPQYPATVQSSALVMTGSFNTDVDSPINFVSYVNKKLDDKFRHFGTRMRVVGRVENSDIRSQSATGSSTYFTTTNTRTDQDISIAGGSGGIAVLLNPETNNGYYFEIAALTAANISDYETETNVKNVFFYKVKRNSAASADSENAVAVKLFSGIANIGVDSGNFAGQARLSTETSPTVFDLAVEYQDLGETRRFYLYINNVIVGIVDDDDPLPTYNNVALFVRGSAKCMFENIYALNQNYAQNSVFALDAPVVSSFGDDEISATDSFRKYAMSGLVQSTYLAGISDNEPPKYNIYFEEFGTIMREAAYFDVRYDKAYPALSAKVSPTFNRTKGYTVSGFRAGAYGAEFLIFNNTDSTLVLDSDSGNYLRIQGVTFTQQSNNELSVDEYFEKVGNLSDPEFVGDGVLLSPEKAKQDFTDIKLSRLTQGRSNFSIEAPYVQSHDSAYSLMKWLTEKIMKPRKSVGVEVFGLPTAQLGDIVQVSYRNENGVNEISAEDSRFVVYYIDYSRSPTGPSMNIYLSEVV